MRFGLSAEGGSPNTLHATRPSESPLSEHLTLVRNPGASRFGYFLRAETMHGLYTYLERLGGASSDPAFHEMSHGESFLALIGSRFREAGLWVLDEPESALSFTGCMGLLGHPTELLQDDRNQVILSTHSPLLAALPGARSTRWATGACGAASGTTSTSSGCGGPSSTPRSGSSGICEHELAASGGQEQSSWTFSRPTEICSTTSSGFAWKAIPVPSGPVSRSSVLPLFTGDGRSISPEG